MALVNMDFFSYYLGMDTPMTVLLPEKRGRKPELEPDKKYPVLYLLHGHADDNTAWIRKSNIEMLTRDFGIIVVMPTAHRGFYTNAKHGHAYFDYLSKELPVVIANLFPASTKREDTYVAGLSMGGYGAMKLALTCPEQYGHAASMSGASDSYCALRHSRDMFSVGDFMENIDNVFGGEEQFYGSENDLCHLANELQKRADVSQPQLYMCSGTEDPLWPVYCEIKQHLQKKTSLSVTFDERKGGHNWDFWNEELPIILRFFGLIPDVTTGL